MEMTPAQVLPVPATRLWNRNFVLLWQGQTVSQLGNEAFLVAMMFWTMETTGSASLMGLLMTISSLPGVVLAPFGGALADRWSRVRIIVVCDVIAGLGVLALGFAMRAWSGETQLLLGLLFAVAVLEGVVRAFFMPAVSATIPDLVPAERLAAANSANQFSIQTSVFLGQAVGGVLYRLLGAPLLFILDGVSYLFSALSEAFIRAPRPVPPPRDEAVHPLRQLARETADGLRWVWRRPGMRDFIVVASLLNFLAMPMFVLFPFYVSDVLGTGAEWYGFLLAAISAGSAAGFVVAGTLRISGAVRGWTLVAAMVVGPGLFGLLGLVRLPWAALATAFAGGVALGVLNIFLITLLQSSTPPELRGRVMGLLATLGGALIPLGSALGGFAGDLTGKNIPLVFGVCGALSVAATALLATRRDCRAFLAGAETTV